MNSNSKPMSITAINNMGNTLIDLTDKKFGKWYVISLDDDIRLWKCRCDCGTIKKVWGNSLRRGKSIGCRKCQHSSLNFTLSQKIGECNKHWKGYKDISMSYVTRLKNNARKRNLTFDVTIEFLWELFIKQNRQCALSGIPLQFRSRVAKSDGNASLDRIDSTKGYIEGNVQWVDKDINSIKSDYSQQRFIELCKQVATYKT